MTTIGNNVKQERRHKMLTTIFDEMDNMFKRVDAMFNYPRSSTFANQGLKAIIRRPHNLITKKDKDGNVESYDIEVVYTPFSKDEVKVEVLDHVLTVKCGSENKVKDEDMDYCGISHKSYEFSFPLADTVDEKAITAKAEDGILYINFPVKKLEIKKAEPLAIEVK